MTGVPIPGPAFPPLGPAAKKGAVSVRGVEKGAPGLGALVELWAGPRERAGPTVGGTRSARWAGRSPRPASSRRWAGARAGSGASRMLSAARVRTRDASLVRPLPSHGGGLAPQGAPAAQTGSRQREPRAGGGRPERASTGPAGGANPGPGPWGPSPWARLAPTPSEGAPGARGPRKDRSKAVLRADFSSTSFS